MSCLRGRGMSEGKNIGMDFEIFRSESRDI